ncbi:unnamed protein product [Protopolystoma xenopodis]|uniref:Uncharacterized protein n=1 Tax=Protopolystoma xenopodis TaxID=117903 RepID=A0A448WEH5_9PLAT|nr:unnamed protein product [Protopolystoma xenopodis]
MATAVGFTLPNPSCDSETEKFILLLKQLHSFGRSEAKAAVFGSTLNSKQQISGPEQLSTWPSQDATNGEPWTIAPMDNPIYLTGGGLDELANHVNKLDSFLMNLAVSPRVQTSLSSAHEFPQLFEPSMFKSAIMDSCEHTPLLSKIKRINSKTTEERDSLKKTSLAQLKKKIRKRKNKTANKLKLLSSQNT